MSHIFLSVGLSPASGSSRMRFEELRWVKGRNYLPDWGRDEKLWEVAQLLGKKRKEENGHVPGLE